MPQDIAQAALELAAERFRAAERIGLRSKSIGGQETIAYDTSAMSAPIQAMLQPYKRSHPLMFALEFEGLEETSARLDAYPAALQAALGAKATELAAALADLVKNDKLSGAVLNTRSGALSEFDRGQRN